MSTDELRDRLIQALEAAAASYAIDIVDVEIAGVPAHPILRIYIDHACAEDTLAPAPITLDEVSAQQSWINEVIDAQNPFDASYTLEVSSPGLSRKLRRVDHFKRFVHHDIALKTRASEGRTRYTGELSEATDEDIAVVCDGETFRFPYSAIKTCALKPHFD